MKKTLFLLICILSVGISGIAQNALNKKAIKKMKLDNGMYAVMSTNKGDILLNLTYIKTPLTVANFVGLAEGNFEHDTLKIDKPYYDGLVFHRVIPNFMVQGGDPKGTGQGGPGYKFWDEFDADLRHEGPGILSMANAGPSTNGSQFFITHKATPWLNDKHTVFGKLIVGQEVVDNIAQNDTLKKLTIYRIGKTAKKFNATIVFASNYLDIETKMKEKQEADRLAAEARKNMTEAQKIEKFKVEMLKKYPTAIQTPSGLMYVVEKEGEGAKPTIGTKINVHYTGFLTDGKQFDSSVDRGQPFSFPCGQGRVIKGWDEGLMLMNKGAKYKLLVPYWLGYGERESGPIPPFSDLVFDVELLSF